MVVLCPDPTLSRGKGSGDHWAFSWLCRVSSLDFEQANELAQSHTHTCVEASQWNIPLRYIKNFIQKSRLLTWHNQGSAPIVTRPFSSWEDRVWSGDKTRPMVAHSLASSSTVVAWWVSSYHLPLITVKTVTMSSTHWPPSLAQFLMLLILCNFNVLLSSCDSGSYNLNTATWVKMKTYSFIWQLGREEPKSHHANKLATFSGLPTIQFWLLIVCKNGEGLVHFIMWMMSVST